MRKTAENLLNEGWHNTSIKVDGKELWQRRIEYLLFDRKNGLTNQYSMKGAIR